MAENDENRVSGFLYVQSISLDPFHLNDGIGPDFFLIGIGFRAVFNTVNFYVSLPSNIIDAIIK